MQRQASCQCGQLTAATDGEPARVVACSCTACQRRSGSPFGEAAYFLKSQVRTHGTSTSYERKADSGRWFRTHFCPTCGTSLYWHMERSPDMVGVAVGAFADPSFPPPVRAVWTDQQHPWVHWPDRTETFPAQSTA